MYFIYKAICSKYVLQHLTYYQLLAPIIVYDIIHIPIIIVPMINNVTVQYNAIT